MLRRDGWDRNGGEKRDLENRGAQAPGSFGAIPWSRLVRDTCLPSLGFEAAGLPQRQEARSPELTWSSEWAEGPGTICSPFPQTNLR